SCQPGPAARAGGGHRAGVLGAAMIAAPPGRLAGSGTQPEALIAEARRRRRRRWRRRAVLAVMAGLLAVAVAAGVRGLPGRAGRPAVTAPGAGPAQVAAMPSRVVAWI